jgi:hypothetical protein
MGIDPAWGSSAFGIVVTQWAHGIVQNYMQRSIIGLITMNVYGLMSKYDVDKVYIDGANPSFIKSLKLQIGEDPDYDNLIAKYRAERLDDNWI